ncbi:MAG TPA: hypothetical protein VH558_14150, partial [Pseudolabrys sp.]
MNPAESKKLVRRLATVLMMSAAPFVAAGQAQAACTPPTPANNALISCTGGSITQNGTAGYGTGNEGGNNITVDSTATVTGTVNGFLLGDVNTIINDGTVEATGANGTAIEAKSAGATIIVKNSKTIQATASGGTGIKAGVVTLSNALTGTISADNVAIDGTGLSGSSVSMSAAGDGNFGLIEATGPGGIAIKSAADANILNAARIEAKAAGGTAIEATSKAIVHNLVGATIAGGATGIDATTLDITNEGEISGGNTGIAGQGSITNSGVIFGGTGPGKGAVVFTGGAGTTNTLTLKTGSQLIGDAIGSTGAANNLILQGTGTANNNFLDFNSLDVQAGGNGWVLNGDASVGTATLESKLMVGDGTTPTFTGDVIVNSGGSLSGTGRIVGNISVLSGGTLLPGRGGPSTFNVTGSVTFEKTSLFQVRVFPSANGNNLSADSVNIKGGRVDVAAGSGNYKPSTTYTIITTTAANGVQGKFDTVFVDLPFLHSTLTYDPSHVFLTLDLVTAPGGGGSGGTPAFAAVAQTRNQHAVATSLAGGSLANALVLRVLNQTLDGARAAFDALSGEIFASVHNAQGQEASFTRSGILGRLRQASYSDAP